MTNFDVVKKLIGNIRPVGKSEVDAERLENLKNMCILMDEIHSVIDAVAYDFKDDKQGSVVKCCDYANQFLDKLGMSGYTENNKNIIEHRRIIQDWYETDMTKTGWDSHGWFFSDGETISNEWTVVEHVEFDKFGNPITGIAERECTI